MIKSSDIILYEVRLGKYKQWGQGGLKGIPHIQLHTADGHDAHIHFIPPNNPLPQNTTAVLSGDKMNAIIYAPADQFIWYLDLFRNEKTKITFNSEDPENTWVFTERPTTAGWGHLD